MTYCDVIQAPSTNLVQLIENVSQLSSTSGIAASNLQIRESLFDSRVKHFQEVFRLVTIGQHAGVVSWIEVRLVVSAQHGDRDILLFLVKLNVSNQIVRIRLSPIRRAIATTDTTDQPAVAFVLVALHAARSAPGVGVDEQVWVVFESCLGQVDLTCVLAVPCIVEWSRWRCWAGAKDGSLCRGLDQVADYRQGADVLVEQCLGHFLLVVVR